MASPIRQLLRVSAIAALALSAVHAPTAGAASGGGWQPDVAAVVNGSTLDDATFRARWGFTVALVGARAANQYDGQYCGGTLVDDQHVVTAAHCVTVRPGVPLAPTAIRVVANTRELSTISRGSGESAPRRIKEIFVHPDFALNSGDGFRYDVAVVRLTEPIPAARTIPLVQAGEDAIWGAGAGGATAEVAGWGDTDPQERRDPGDRYPTDLRVASIPLHSDARCSSTVGGGYGTTFERATNLCGGTLQSGSTLGTDSCQGDSGGPLVADAADGTRRLVGITSWGEGCAERTFGAYARIAALRGWLDSIPGLSDGGQAIGGPGGTLGVADLRRARFDYRSARLAWSPAPWGTTAERYGIWRRTLVSGEVAEELLGITTNTTFRAFSPPTRRTNAYRYVVRPLDTDGSAGPVATILSGPRPDRVRPTMVRRILLAARTRSSLTIRWTSARDLQSGIRRYQVQRRIVGRSGWRLVDVAGRTPSRVPITGLRPGDRVIVRIRAVDLAGNAGRWRVSTVLRTRR